MALSMNDRTRLYIETLQRVTWRDQKPLDQDVGYFYSRLNGMFSACYCRQSMCMRDWRELIFGKMNQTKCTVELADMFQGYLETKNRTQS